VASRAALKTRARKVVQIWVDLFARHDLLTYASAIAFQVLKSLIPLSLLGIALLGAVGRRDVWTDHLAPQLQKRFDPPVFEAIDFAVKKIFASESGPLLVFAALLTIWYVSGGVRAIIGGINRVYETDEDRPFWIRWPISFGLAVCVVAGLVGAALLIEAVPKSTGPLDVLLTVARWIGAVVVLAVAAGLLVRLGPVKRRPKKWASAGAVLVVATWIVTSIVFKWYVSSVANFKTAVGQLTVFIILMVYVYASSIVFLVGVELDELLREDASAGERGILDVVLGR
jgi:membrane protein